MDKGLEAEFLGVKTVNPLVLPAGIMDVSYGSMLYAVENGAAVVTMKSLTLAPREGNKTPVYTEIEGGAINSMGLCNPGIDAGLMEIEKFKEHSDVPVIASVFATSAEDFVSLSSSVNDSKADFIELNLSCPNVSSEFGIPLAASSEEVAKIVTAVKKVSKKPVLAKLSPNTYNVKEVALGAQNAGADAVVLINTLGPGMVIDVYAQRPVISAKFGGLSGPCVRPVAIKLVYEVSRALDIPVIGMGGVSRGEDAVEMLLAGATLVGVGTAVAHRGITVYRKICNEILQYMDTMKYSSIQDIKPIS